MEPRPERSTRGRRPKLSQQQEQKEEEIYAKMFGDVDDDSSESYVEKKPIFLVRGQKLKANIHDFPYARSHHYYYDLQGLPRLGQSSYVQDPNWTTEDRLLKQNYNDQQLFQQMNNKGLGTTDLINRKYIGLPGNIPKSGPSIHGDKNPCHVFLFSNEDRKWRIDQLLSELQYISKKPDILENNLAKQYSSIKRDPELASLYDQNIPLEGKKLLLEKKIEALEKRKSRLKEEFEFEDWLFYPSSLNQKFFNEHSANELSLINIVSEGIYLYNISKELKGVPTDEDTLRKATLYFSVYNTIGQGNPILVDFLKDFFPAKASTTVPPSYIMNFTNQENFRKVEQILSIRTLQVYGDTTFYQLKSFWRKIFAVDLTFENEFVAMKKEDYAATMRNVILNYSQSEKTAQNEDVVLPEAGTTDRYFGSTLSILLTSREYLLVYLVYYIYERVGFFNLEAKLIGEETFNKYQFKIVELIGEPFAATFEPAIKRFVDIICRAVSIPQLEMDIFWELRERVGLIWMKEREVWETDEEQQQAHLADPSNENSQLPIEAYDQPQKRVKEV